ncbi:TPA: hypothetical protein ACX3DU_004184 [Vibrio parahaemolyticus]|uniref:hypothetical protein n=1 Tax=Vibrio parahaemolyticus TaxID=670 RepID=UPI0024AFD4F7|nr:hypothetical protein [Vibrio parahaemolyticus]MDI7855117.1 hypothetical protein [Vibrio parahaemolyticus]
MKNYFAEIMKLVIRPDYRSSSAVTQAMHEEFADAQLVIGAQAQMAEKLNQYRQKGRYGWWNEEVCTIDELYSYRQKALDDNDHTSVLTFTSMIAAREAHKEALKNQGGK